MSLDHNAWPRHHLKFDNSSFERVEQFKYLWTTITKQNSIQEEIKSRLESGNAPYHSVQNLLSCSLLSKNIKIKICRPIILSVLCWCETWSLISREEYGLRVLENRVLRRIFQERRKRDFGGKPEGKRLLGRPWCRWEDNISMDLQEVGWGDGLD